MAASAIRTASANSRCQVTKPGRGGEHERDRGAAEQLDHPAREPTVGERAEVAAEAAVLTAEHVVEEAEQPEPERGEEHERPGRVRAGLVTESDRPEPGPARLHDQHGHHEHAARRR